MPINSKKEDLRITKTYKALREALLMLLERQNFSQITVNDLCEKAQISRTTFYTHFSDKYDLLKYLLENAIPKLKDTEDPYAKVELAFNYFIYDKIKAIKNLFENANNETLVLLQNFLVSLLNLTDLEKEDIQAKRKSREADLLVTNQRLKQKSITIFCAGGMVNFLFWQVKNQSVDSQELNHYFYEILRYLLEWDMSKEGERTLPGE